MFLSLEYIIQRTYEEIKSESGILLRQSAQHAGMTSLFLKLMCNRPSPPVYKYSKTKKRKQNSFPEYSKKEK